MMNSDQIDFYIDDQNQVIPASIALRHLKEISPLGQHLALNSGAISAKVNLENGSNTNTWLWAAAILTGVCSAGALWLQHQPLSLHLFGTLPVSTVSPQQASTLYYSMVHQPGLASPTAPTMLPPETSRSATEHAAYTPTSPAASGATNVSHNLLQQAQTTAERASSFAKTAQAIDDWGLIANQWRKAIELLNRVPNHDVNYGIAQQKIAAYQINLRVAQQKANQPIVEAPMPTTKVQFIDGVACRSKASSAATVEISEVKFLATAQAETEGYIVGCITNRTNRTISNLSLTYRATATEQPNLVQAGNEVINLSEIEPGKTAIFRTPIVLNPRITTIRVELLSWNAVGLADPQVATPAIELVR